MALEYKIDEEAHGKLDEAIQGLYKQDGDSFKLEVVGTDEAVELKEALRKEREERAAAKQRLKELEQTAEEIEKKRLQEKGEYKSLFEKEQESKLATAKELAELRDKIANGERNDAALKVASVLTRDAAKLELLKKEALSLIAHTEDGTKINGPDGSAWTPEQLGEHLTKNYPFLVDGNQSTGGGAPGGDGSGSAKTMKRGDFDAQTHTARAKFIQDGGTVID